MHAGRVNEDGFEGGNLQLDSAKRFSFDFSSFFLSLSLSFFLFTKEYLNSDADEFKLG